MSNILEEVKKLLGKGAIELVPPGQEGQGFYSTFFIVPKKDGGLRPILNLKLLNVYMEKSHFKMETLRSIIQALRVGEWGSTLDLRDAYLQIPMFPPHRKYLRFCVQGVHYQFRAMPFGITVAPRVFTKLMAAVGGHLRSQQIHIFMYLDDWRVKNQIRELLLHQLNRTIQLLVDLGLIINLDKCHLVPSQIITYLGAVFNLNKGLVLPSENRFLAINQAIADIIYNHQCPASHFLRLLGLMASCIDTVPYGRLHMLPIQIYLLYFWRPHIDGLHFKIPVFPILATHLMWWQQEEEYFQRGTPAGISTKQSSVDRCIQVGLGCTLGHSSGGRSVDEGIDQSSYQLARDESCMECFDRVSGGDSGRESAYQMRQCHSSGIYKQARGNQINTTLSSFMGHDAVVFKTQHSHPCSSYSRVNELSCRQVVDQQSVQNIKVGVVVQLALMETFQN